MNSRTLKIVLVCFVSLGALIWAIQNIVNIDAAYASVAYVTSNVDHEAYPDSFGPSFGSPVLVWLALAVILAGELATGLLAAKGAYDMFSRRKAPAAEFNAAKRFATLGCGMALIVWFGIFGVIGGAFFQMWQTDIGHGSFADGLLYAIPNGLILLFLEFRDE